MLNNPESTKLRVLVVDDERLSRQTTVLQLRDAGYFAEAAESGGEALEFLQRVEWDVVLSDLRMPGMDGLSLLKHIRDNHPRLEVIVMTAYGTVETAVSAMRAGAVDYLLKPFRFDELEVRLSRLAEVRACRRENAELRAMVGSAAERGGLVGGCPAMRRVFERIDLFADNTAPVLVTGETGTGKELVARALHARGTRRRAPFVAVPCGAIPSELAESELFGHGRGAFTGASTARAGAFERADGGTLLLDDIDDLPLPLQAKLLRVLQDGTFTRVGGQAETRVDIRVVATTKVQLEEAVLAGLFRRDLFYRLRALEIHLPPLRVREDDILELARHFVRLHGERAGRPALDVSSSAASLLGAFPWPGNVRELGHAMAYAVAVCQGNAIEPQHLPDHIRENADAPTKLVSLHLQGLERVSLAAVVHGVEQELIRWALAQAQGHQTKAAELLGLPRTTLQSKLGKP